MGSSGVEYALTAEGAATPLSGHEGHFEAPGGRGPIAVVSGSCSPTTSRQIRYALDHGFAGILAWTPIRRLLLGWIKTPAFAMSSGEPDA